MTGDYIPDPIELGEARAERWAAERVHGDMFKCQCGKTCKLSHCEAISPDPYSEPICPSCFRDFVACHRPKKGK